LCRACQAYAELKTAQGHPDQGVESLIELHSVARKALPFSRTFVDKMLWANIAARNVEAAYHLSCSPHADTNTLVKLKDAFPPLRDEEIALRPPLIACYLETKHICRREVPHRGLLALFDLYIIGEIVESPNGGKSESICPPKPKSGFWRTVLSKTLTLLTFRKNKTVRDFRRYYDVLLECAARRPPDTKPVDAYAGKYAGRPRMTNLGGWAVVSASTFGMSNYFNDLSQTKVLSDLLALHLRRQLGEDASMQDYFTGSDYRINAASNEVRSAGIDRQYGTSDDICLRNGRVVNPDF
jgi:hypothetical protein